MFDLSTAGRGIAILGLALTLVGGLIWIAGRADIPLGKIPGDFRFQIGSVSCFLPLASSIILSVLLTIVLNLILRWLNK
ncbi:MAG: DUF2905 domain-containing protein [Anaerolineales bacterium]